MAIKDYNRKAREKYREKVQRVYIELYPPDEDIKKRFEDRKNAGEPMTTYIKRLIREDMQKRG